MLGVAFVVAIVLFVAPPVMWVAWWLLADLAQTANYRPATSGFEIKEQRHRPAA